MRVGLTFNARGGWNGQSVPILAANRADGAQQASGSLAMLETDDAEEEFDSPATIQSLAEVLASFGHEVRLLGDGPDLLRRLLDEPLPDLVFNIAEGQGVARSREARVPAVLEMLGVPYTGSDPLCLAASLDKDCAKRLVAQAGVPTPRWIAVEEPADPAIAECREFAWPLILKPAYEGSSKGVRFKSLVRDEGELRSVLAEMCGHYRQPILIEEYIEGAELTVGLVGNPPEVLGVMQVIPKQAAQGFIYSLEVKRDWEDRIRYECPARLTPAATRAVEQAALAAWKALGCRDVARIDFRLRGETPYFLEANPLPGLSPQSSDLVFLANFVGVSHAELLRRILNAACERVGL